MEINKKQLKTISFEFRTKAKVLLNTDFQEFNNNLKRFINYIENEELIIEYINSKITEKFDVEQELKEIRENYGRAIFDIGVTEQEEVSNVYQILKHISANNVEIIYSGILCGYTSSSKYQDMVDSFNKRVVDVLIQNILSYLTKIGINMGLDEEIKYMIHNDNGNMQINISKDNSNLTATQEITTYNNDLLKLAENIEQLINDKIEKDVQEEIKENINCIKELSKEKEPKKSFLAVCKNSLYNILPKIKDATELTAAILAIVDFINKLPK